MKLNPALAAKAAAVETADFKPIPAGTYTALLVGVELKTSQKGNSYWNWKYKVTGPGEGKHIGRLLWDNTSLMDTVAWKIQQVCIAHGTTPEELDTDELVGISSVRLVVGVEESEYGKTAGQMVNRVVKVLPLATDEEEEDAAPVASISEPIASSDEPAGTASGAASTLF